MTDTIRIEQVKQGLRRAAIDATHQDTGVVLQFVALPVALNALDDLLAAVQGSSSLRHEEDKKGTK